MDLGCSKIRCQGLAPDVYMVTRVPVISPSFRPCAVQGTTFILGDANKLYRDLVKVRDGYNEEEANRELEVKTKVRPVIYSRAPP